MKIVKGEYTVEVPLGLPSDGKVRNGYQVFLQNDTKQIDKHVEALTRLPKYLGNQGTSSLTRILHPFAGLGVTAQILDQGCKTKLKHTMWERDIVCAEHLLKEGYDTTVVQDSYELLQDHNLHGYDAVIFDPTAGTIKTPGMTEFWENAADCSVPVVWVTDSACSKIWLHKTHYKPELGRIVADAEDYLRAYNTMLEHLGYRIVEAMREATVTYFVAVRDTSKASVPFTHIERL